MGRFAQADSIVPGGMQGLDRYAYVGNSPARYTDPTGHMCSDPDDPTRTCEYGEYPNNAQTLRDPKRRTVVILLGGSNGSDLSQVGPNPDKQTPAWAERTTPEYTYTYPGSKEEQALQAIKDLGEQDVDIILIGYSAGADAALMFADLYNGPGKITDMVLIGPTFTGEYSSGKDLATEWRRILTEKLLEGTDIMIIDDKNPYTDQADPDDDGGYHPPQAPNIGTFTFLEVDGKEHWDGGYPGLGTNNDPDFVEMIFYWIINY